MSARIALRDLSDLELAFLAIRLADQLRRAGEKEGVGRMRSVALRALRLGAASTRRPRKPGAPS